MVSPPSIHLGRLLTRCNTCICSHFHCYRHFSCILCPHQIGIIDQIISGQSFCYFYYYHSTFFNYNPQITPATTAADDHSIRYKNCSTILANLNYGDHTLIGSRVKEIQSQLLDYAIFLSIVTLPHSLLPGHALNIH